MRNFFRGLISSIATFISNLFSRKGSKDNEGRPAERRYISKFFQSSALKQARTHKSNFSNSNQVESSVENRLKV